MPRSMQGATGIVRAAAVGAALSLLLASAPAAAEPRRRPRAVDERTNSLVVRDVDCPEEP
jgi:hypothetical protein